MVFCTKCGTDLPDAANFCFNCGVRTPKGVQASAPIPYKDILSDVENQVEKTFSTATEELKRAFNKARKEITEAASR